MKKLLFISVLLLAFACSKEDEQKDVDPIVGKWTMYNNTYNTNITRKIEVKADGIMVMDDEPFEEKVGECLYVWKNLQTEKTERMLYKFSYCGYRSLSELYVETEWNRCDEIADDFELLQWKDINYIILKWDINFNEDFSDGSGTGYWRAYKGDDEITTYWGDLSKD